MRAYEPSSRHGSGPPRSRRRFYWSAVGLSTGLCLVSLGQALAAKSWVAMSLAGRECRLALAAPAVVAWVALGPNAFGVPIWTLKIAFFRTGFGAVPPQPPVAPSTTFLARPRIGLLFVPIVVPVHHSYSPGGGASGPNSLNSVRNSTNRILTIFRAPMRCLSTISSASSAMSSRCLWKRATISA